MTQLLKHLAFSLVAIAAALAGCAKRDAALYYDPPPPPEMLGTRVDEINQLQESNAEASKYVVYMHEFELNDVFEGTNPGAPRLNEAGEDHLKRIAHNLRRGAPYPVVIERSNTSAWPWTEFGYPIHYNPKLDMQRREVVVRALTLMGIPDAEQRVVVAPAFAQPFTSQEAQGAYSTGIGAGSGGRGGGGGGGAYFGASGF